MHRNEPLLVRVPVRTMELASVGGNAWPLIKGVLKVGWMTSEVRVMRAQAAALWYSRLPVTYTETMLSPSSRRNVLFQLPEAMLADVVLNGTAARPLSTKK